MASSGGADLLDGGMPAETASHRERLPQMEKARLQGSVQAELQQIAKAKMLA